MTTPLASRRPLLWGAFGIGIVAMLALALARSPGYPSDDLHYKYWTRLITLQGIGAAYSGRWPETYAVYGPVPLLFYNAIGVGYRAWGDPSFDLSRAIASLDLTYALKLPGVLFHLLTAALVLRAVALRWGEPRGFAAAALYALNPALLWNISLWGQPDSIHSFFALAGVVLLSYRRSAWGWAALTLAAWSKPQAWVLFPLLLYATWGETGRGGLVRGAVVGLAFSLGIVTPFVLQGTFSQLLNFPNTITSVMPVISANAHNLWWLLLGQEAIVAYDDRIFSGELSFRQYGLLFLGLSYFLALWVYWRHPKREDLPELAAYVAFAFFMVATQIHENHLFTVFPFLSVVVWRSAPMLLLYSLLSLTFLGNLALHDPRLLEGGFQGLAGWSLEELRQANAAANAIVLAVWSFVLLRRGRKAIS